MSCSGVLRRRRFSRGRLSLALSYPIISGVSLNQEVNPITRTQTYLERASARLSLTPRLTPVASQAAGEARQVYHHERLVASSYPRASFLLFALPLFLLPNRILTLAWRAGYEVAGCLSRAERSTVLRKIRHMEKEEVREERAYKLSNAFHVLRLRLGLEWSAPR